MALLAMLGTAPGGERTRNWLQDRLWGSRQRAQAQQSLRRELSALRAALPPQVASLLDADRDRVRLDLAALDLSEADREQGAVFLEGFDIPGEDGFEDWLRQERQRGPLLAPPAPADPSRAQAARRTRPGDAEPLPRFVVDTAQPATGFGGRPALAILPFTNATARPDAEIWADGMTEDLIERVSRLRWLPVIAPSTAAEAAQRKLDALAVGQLLGAAYVLRGRLQEAGRLPDGKQGIALQLTLLDGQSGQLLWSERLPLPGGLTQAVLEDVAHSVVGSLDARIDTEEQVRVISRRVEELTFNETLWRARWHLHRLTREDARIAADLLDRALAEQPNSADVLVQVAFARAWDIWSGRMGPDTMREMRSLAQRAIAADQFDGRGYMLAGMAEMWMRNHANAEALFDEALQLNPSLARAHAQRGSCHYLAGQPERAFDPLRLALRLSPLDNQVFYVLGELAVAHCMLEHWAEAVRHADLSIARRPAYFYAHVVKVNALVRAGQQAAARKALAALHAAKPGFQPTDVDWLPFRERAWNQFFKDGLRMAEDG